MPGTIFPVKLRCWFLALLPGIAVAAFATPPSARAEACAGWVYVSVGHNRPLASSTPMRVSGDCPEFSYDATVQPYLKVGARRVAKLHSFSVRQVTTRPQRSTLHIPRRYVRAARRLGARSGHRRAVLTLVIQGTIRETGQTFQSTSDTFFVLHKG